MQRCVATLAFSRVRFTPVKERLVRGSRETVSTSRSAATEIFSIPPKRSKSGAGAASRTGPAQPTVKIALTMARHTILNKCFRLIISYIPFETTQRRTGGHQPMAEHVRGAETTAPPLCVPLARLLIFPKAIVRLIVKRPCSVAAQVLFVVYAGVFFILARTPRCWDHCWRNAILPCSGFNLPREEQRRQGFVQVTLALFWYKYVPSWIY